MKITGESILAALGILLCFVGVHRFTPWTETERFTYRQCRICPEFEIRNKGN